MLRDIGYDDAEYGSDHRGCAVLVAYYKQSPDIAQGVDEGSGRYVAKYIVAAGLAQRRLVQVSYDIGAARPTSVMLSPYGTGRIAHNQLEALVRRHFDLRPKGIVQMLDLLWPIYRKTAAYGHFGREQQEFTWERTDKAQALAADC